MVGFLSKKAGSQDNRNQKKQKDKKEEAAEGWRRRKMEWDRTGWERRGCDVLRCFFPLKIYRRMVIVCTCLLFDVDVKPH